MNITPVRVAVLDLYQGEPNEGMRNIKAILERFKKFVDYKVYDVRSALHKCRIWSMTSTFHQAD